MKKMIVLITGCLLILAGCAKKHIPTKSVEAEKNEAAELKAKYSGEQIARGQNIFMGHCGKCHEFHQPGELTIKKWNKILPDMASKSKLTSEESDLVRAWVITNAKS